MFHKGLLYIYEVVTNPEPKKGLVRMIIQSNRGYPAVEVFNSAQKWLAPLDLTQRKVPAT